MVQVGDYVEEGQVLCILDTEDLALNIEQLRADLNISQQSSLNQYETSRRIYEEADADLSGNNNAQVIAAQSTLRSAEVSLKNAQRTYNDIYQDYINNEDHQVEAARLSMERAQKSYNDALEDYNENSDANIMAAESAVESIKLDLDVKETAYNNNKILHASGVIPDFEYTQSKNLYTDALNRYDEAVNNLESIKTTQTRTLEQLKNALNTAITNYNNAETSQSRAVEQARNSLESAQTAYNNALASYNSAIGLAGQEVDMHRSNLDSAEIAMNKDSMLINLRRLEKQLDDSIIKSPASGTVTAVYAEEGSVVAGLLFIVEDTNNLRISSSVKEHDYSRVQIGQKVVIRSDSTGDYEYEGIISRIDPAANRHASDVEFGMIIEITSDETLLKIGMNTRLSIVMEEKSNIFYVPYDAVTKNKNGEDIIFAAKEERSGNFSLRQIIVGVGMSSDFHLEIAGDKLEDGMMVIDNASTITDKLDDLNIRINRISRTRFKLT
jgi:RND family efflux transporter MFP subunit